MPKDPNTSHIRAGGFGLRFSFRVYHRGVGFKVADPANFMPGSFGTHRCGPYLLVVRAQGLGCSVG